MPIPLYQAKAEFFRTLGHPARIRILELLSDEDLPVHQLLAAIAIEPSNLSQQLSVLRQAGLVSQRREGGEVIYSLALPEEDPRAQVHDIYDWVGYLQETLVQAVS